MTVSEIEPGDSLWIKECSQVDFGVSMMDPVCSRGKGGLQQGIISLFLTLISLSSFNQKNFQNNSYTDLSG